MNSLKLAPTTRSLILIVMLTVLGCDDRVAQVARESADRQAKQNETMAALQQEVAAGSRKLVEEDGAARRQVLQLHQDLQSERAQLSTGWNDLETERQGIAASRRTDSLVAAILRSGTATMAAILALAFAYVAIFGLSRTDASSADACELLFEQVLAPPQPGEPKTGDDANAEQLLGDSRPRFLPPATQAGRSGVLDSGRDL